VSDAAGRLEPFEGWLVDYSQGGVGLEVPRAVAVGADLGLRPGKGRAAERIQVKVRHCRRSADRRWHLGCEFIHLPPGGMAELLG
jgi:hypothetical protein